MDYTFNKVVGVFNEDEDVTMYSGVKNNIVDIWVKTDMVITLRRHPAFARRRTHRWSARVSYFLD